MAADLTELKSNYELQRLLHDLESSLAALNPLPSRSSAVLQLHLGQQMQRGPMYESYSLLRESKLRQKMAQPLAKASPKKKVMFAVGPTSRKEALAVASSVPDFSSMLRKENKKPNLGSEVTPPPMGAKGGWRGGVLSKSAKGGEKRCGGGATAAAVRKSCVSLRELKGLSAAAGSAINEEGRGGRSKGVLKKAILGSIK